MPEHFLISVDFKDVEGDLSLKTISFLGNLHITVNSETYDDALKFLRSHGDQINIFCDCSAIEDLEKIITVLNAGAQKVFVLEREMRALLEHRMLQEQNSDRLILAFRGANIDDPEVQIKRLNRTIKVIQKPSVGIGFEGFSEAVESLQLLAQYKDRLQCYVKLTSNLRAEYTKTLEYGFVAIVPARGLTMNPQKDPSLFQAHSLITNAIHSDRSDGLFPTVVSDERRTCLGLVYSSNESIAMALQTGCGVYYSRSRKGLWVKGQESGNKQELISITMDCDSDALQFKVRQKGEGFCHLQSPTCFGAYDGISRLVKTLQERKQSAPTDSYTAKLFKDPKFLQAKIMEEASELCEAKSKTEIAAEAADLLYFALAKCVSAGVTLEDIESNLDRKSLKVTRRKGHTKPRWTDKIGLSNITSGSNGVVDGVAGAASGVQRIEEVPSVSKAKDDSAGFANGRIQMKRYRTTQTSPETIRDLLQRPSQRSTEEVMSMVKPIIDDVRYGGNAALLKYTRKFEKATSLISPVLKAPFPEHLMQLPPETIKAINISFENIRRFHAAQKEEKPLQVETMPGIICSRFSRPIERVGLYVPGGTAVLPSTALMLGVPAMVAGCKTIVLASPPRNDGTISPEIVYIAHKVGAESIVLAGGAQAVAALAYGTETISKVDKILGPGNQFVTAGKMTVSNDTTAGVSIDMPAGPSEVLVIADRTSNPAFVASDLLSQAEHGTDSQVILIAIGLSDNELSAIEDELHAQASVLPRVDIVRGAIEHSVTLVVRNIEEAMHFSNQYAPEHLILQVKDAQDVVEMVENAGSVFVGPWTPESVGDYSAGVNHSLPTYGYAKQYSGVNLSSFTKHITSANLTQQGLKNVGGTVMQLAKVEALEGHRRAVDIRLEHMI